MSSATSEAEEAKKLGNECVKNGKHIEAMLHYTKAIKLDPKNHTLYSNRSLAFLKIDQYYHALEDAQQVIKLKPNWPKGYFRKGEVEFHAQHYKDALMSYRQGLMLEPEDVGLQDAVSKASKDFKEQKKQEARIPWMGVGIGLLLGVLIVIGDEVLTDNPALKFVLLKLFVVVLIASAGYGLAVAYRYFLRSQRDSLLDKPIDIFGDDDDDSSTDTSNANSHPEDNSAANAQMGRPQKRSGTAAARQRYKKGKS